MVFAHGLEDHPIELLILIKVFPRNLDSAVWSLHTVDRLAG
jgi:hypothetical protein